MSTTAASIAPKRLELETSNLVGGFVLGMRAGAQIIFPKCGRGLASRSIRWGTCRLANVVSLGAQVQTGVEDRRRGRLTGAMCA